MPRGTIRTFKGKKKGKKESPEPFSQKNKGQTFHRQFVSDKKQSGPKSKSRKHK